MKKKSLFHIIWNINSLVLKPKTRSLGSTAKKEIKLKKDATKEQKNNKYCLK